MDASLSNVFEEIKDLRPASILDVVPRSVFKEIDDLNYRHIGNGNAYEWKFAIAKFLQPKSVLEIGVRYGYSLASFIMGSDAIEQVEGWDSEIYVIGSNAVAMLAIQQLPKTPKTVLRKIDSSQVKSIPRQFDLIHVDSSHNYEPCLHDLRMCLGSTNAILVDDTLTCPDDMRAVKDFCAENEGSIRALIHIPSHVGESLIIFR
jgi:predicted O-methyltransferase YrrM